MLNRHTWKKAKIIKNKPNNKPKSSEAFNQTPCRQKLDNAKHGDTCTNFIWKPFAFKLILISKKST